MDPPRLVLCYSYRLPSFIVCNLSCVLVDMHLLLSKDLAYQEYIFYLWLRHVTSAGVVTWSKFMLSGMQTPIANKYNELVPS